jgi:hypothetical protein
MNRISKNALLAATLTAALVTTLGAALAGAPSHVMPKAQLPAAYDLRLSAAPEEGKPLLVTLVDPSTGAPIAGGRVVVMHRMEMGIKASPAIQYMPMSLPADGNGNFVCASEHHRPGARLTFRVTLQGEVAKWYDFQVRS